MIDNRHFILFRIYFLKIGLIYHFNLTSFLGKDRATVELNHPNILETNDLNREVTISQK